MPDAVISTPAVPDPAPPPYRAVVYCASAPGNRSEYMHAARELGAMLALEGIGLVYGGASVGLMGAVADGALAEGGDVIGVLPTVLADREIAHSTLVRLKNLYYTETMHERKARMLELADAVVALPGGFGTLDELMEALTWLQLGIHAKPCILVNLLGYYDGLLAFLDRAVHEGFMKTENRARILVASDVRHTIRILREWRT
jgi:hypothetical protein